MRSTLCWSRLLSCGCQQCCGLRISRGSELLVAGTAGAVGVESLLFSLVVNDG